MFGGSSLPLQYLYRHGDEALVLNLGNTNPDMVRLEPVETKTFLEELCESEYMPSEDQLQIDENAPIEGMEKTIPELMNDSNVFLAMDIYVSGEEERQRRICILRGISADEIVINSRHDEKRTVYSKESFISAAMEEI